jgi:hypothetical protein
MFIIYSIGYQHFKLEYNKHYYTPAPTPSVKRSLKMLTLFNYQCLLTGTRLSSPILPVKGSLKVENALCPCRVVKPNVEKSCTGQLSLCLIIAVKD